MLQKSTVQIFLIHKPDKAVLVKNKISNDLVREMTHLTTN